MLWDDSRRVNTRLPEGVSSKQIPKGHIGVSTAKKEGTSVLVRRGLQCQSFGKEREQGGSEIVNEEWSVWSVGQGGE